MSTSTSGPESHTAQDDPTLGGLVHDLTQQVPQLIRSEIRLAQAEMAEKGKRAGLGIGMFSAAGLLAFFGLACLVATAVLGLAHAVPDWLAALIVAVLLFLVGGIVAMVGKKEVQQAVPPAPEHAIEGVKEDIAVVKGEHR
ncbi:MAG: phage holin family protein [Nocardioides sp.]